MKDLFKQNAVFITLSLLLLIALGSALVMIPKGELHLLLCDHHTPARDIFYRYYTHVAEWFPYVLCVLLLLFSRIGDGAFASACQALSALTTQIIKHIVCAPRPLTWFAETMPDVQLPLAEGVRMNYWLSFPSGHTTSFFALAFVLCIIATKKITQTTSPILQSGHTQRACCVLVQVLLFLLAALGGYSRIYLSQHFALDVLGGACVGMLITIVCYAVLSRFKNKKWYNYRILGPKTA